MTMNKSNPCIQCILVESLLYARCWENSLSSQTHIPVGERWEINKISILYSIGKWQMRENGEKKARKVGRKC